MSSEIRLTVDDLEFRPNAQVRAMNLLASWRGDASRLSTYGKTPMGVVSNRNLDYRECQSRDELEDLTAFMSKSYSHTQHILSSLKVMFSDRLKAENESFHPAVSIKYAGLVSNWTSRDYDGLVQVNEEFIDRLLSPIAVRMSADERTDRGLSSHHRGWMLREARFADAYIGDPSTPLISRTVAAAKRKMWRNTFRGLANWNTCDSHSRETYGVPIIYWDGGQDPISIDAITVLVSAIKTASSYSVTAEVYKQFRDEALSNQRQQVREQQYVQRQLSEQSFLKFWDNIKLTKRAMRDGAGDLAHEQFAEIPIQETGTKTSRTWGIEVETVRAQETSTPSGWSGVHDGSLDGGSGSCDCSCDYCEDGEHCDDSSCECYYSSGESLEFVSPILSHFNSKGLRKLCEDLGDEEYNTSPGIHVHVGADDLTVTDVARLLFAYGVIEPLLKPLYHRQVFGYCKETAGNNVQWWMGAARRYYRDTGNVPNPRNIAGDQPADRYHAVNTQSLYKHGTIEFRAMGPFYNYEHLVRWAWMMRELVNVSTLDLDQSVWTKCQSVSDVIKVLRKYGSELPLDKAIASLGNDDAYEE